MKNKELRDKLEDCLIMTGDNPGPPIVHKLKEGISITFDSFSLNLWNEGDWSVEENTK